MLQPLAASASALRTPPQLEAARRAADQAQRRADQEQARADGLAREAGAADRRSDGARSALTALEARLRPSLFAASTARQPGSAVDTLA